MWPVLYYFLATILLAAVDAIRIRITWGRVSNIRHWISWSLAIIAGIIIYFFQSWPWYLYAPMCLFVRLLSYAPTLNLFRGKDYNYESGKTSSSVDADISFWGQRLIGLMGLIVVVLLKIFL